VTIRVWGLRVYLWADVFGWRMLGIGWRAKWVLGFSADLRPRDWGYGPPRPFPTGAAPRGKEGA